MTNFSTVNNSITQQRFIKKLFSPVDNSPLILFRIIFGFLLFYQSLSYITNGVVYENFIRPPFTFTYIGFEFLQPMPGLGMYFYFCFMALLGLLIMVGAWYRFSIAAFTLLWLLIYLMQKSGYNNHYYLVLLLSFLMIFMPANAYCSWDVKRKAVIKKNCCPQWIPRIFIAQCFVVYFFSATSKLAAPDWFSGKFLAIQFSLLSKRHLLGIIYAQKWFPVFLSYAGCLFDLCIVPLLLLKKTRPFALVAACIFHLFNSYTFRIGIFPYLSVALLIFFTNADKVRSVFFKSKPPFLFVKDYVVSYGIRQKVIMYGLCIYLIFQIVLPVRYLFFPGNVFWTEEGYRLSWKMMLRTKSGKIYFKVIDPASQKIWFVDPSHTFAPSHVMWLSTSPDIIWQYAQHIKNDFGKKGFTNVEVYAIDSVSLNRSGYKPFINPATNLAKVKWYPFRHSDWIMPYKDKP